MKTTQILKSILIPTLGISAIGTIAAVSTSCGQTQVAGTSLENTTDCPYVAITANEKSTLKLINNSTNNNPDLQYSTDGIYWTICSESKQINISQGERLYLRGNNPTGWSHSDWNFSFLRITGDVSVSGNVMALLDNGAAPGEQGDITNIPCEYCFYSLFDGSTGITSISEDFLPATNLTNYCYSFMFQYCSSLVKAPNLPATTLADGCYAWMFPYCSALTTAPVLSATTLSTSCFEFMFADCISLSSIKIDYIGNYSDAYFLKWTTSVASSGTFYYNGNQNPQDFKLPSGWVKEGGQYVAITANKNSTLALYSSYGTTISPNLWYSIDNVNWTTYGSTININQGETLYLKGNNCTGWSHSSSDYSSLIIKGDVSISGSVMALLYNGSGPLTKIPNDYCFYHLFSCCEGITSVSEDFLPATSLKPSCYEGMFYGCSSLTTAPELPATTLADSCYTWMFSTCFSLTKSPDLPAKTLAAHCYDHMFYSCIYLKSIKIGYTGNYDSTYFDHWVTNVATSGTLYYDGVESAHDFCFSSGWMTPYQNYVVITANVDSSLILNNRHGNSVNLQYSTDGTNWYQYTTQIGIPQGQRLFLKGNNPTGWSKNEPNMNERSSGFEIIGDVFISGNVMGLLDNGAAPGEEGDITDIPCDYCFQDLFSHSTGITGVYYGFLPATNLKKGCYLGTFYYCTSLTVAPDLPATNLAQNCYNCMFDHCKSLTSVKIYYTGNHNTCFGSFWVDEVAGHGTFYYNGGQDAEDFEFPSGWTTQRF